MRPNHPIQRNLRSFQVRRCIFQKTQKVTHIVLEKLKAAKYQTICLRWKSDDHYWKHISWTFTRKNLTFFQISILQVFVPSKLQIGQQNITLKMRSEIKNNLVQIIFTRNIGVFCSFYSSWLLFADRWRNYMFTGVALDFFVGYCESNLANDRPGTNNGQRNSKARILLCCFFDYCSFLSLYLFFANSFRLRGKQTFSSKNKLMTVFWYSKPSLKIEEAKSVAIFTRFDLAE